MASSLKTRLSDWLHPRAAGRAFEWERWGRRRGYHFQPNGPWNETQGDKRLAQLTGEQWAPRPEEAYTNRQTGCYPTITLGSGTLNIMEIAFRTKALRTVCLNEKAMDERFGAQAGALLRRWLADIRAADCLRDVPLIRLSAVSKRPGETTIDLTGILDRGD